MAEAAMGPAAILVIDDERKLCEMLKRRLEQDGQYRVTTACTGREGLERAKGRSYDLAITDFALPDMDGTMVLEALKTMQPDMPVLLFSIYHDDPETIPPAAGHQADGVINKMIDHEQLFRAVRQALAKKGQGPAPRQHSVNDS